MTADEVIHEFIVLVREKRRRERNRQYQSRPDLRDHRRERARQYNRDNVVFVAGMRFNRRTDDPNLVSVAERIRETKSLLRDMEEPK
jgi:NAD dependent epimerase/dehydratase family enzyme